MADDSNILQNIARGYRKSLAPVSEASRSNEARDGLLQTLGQQPGTSNAKPASTEASEQKADNLLDKSPKDFTKDDWKAVLAELKNVYKAAKEFVQQTDFSSGWDVADEALFFLVQVLTSDFVFKNYPLVYTIADATGLAQDQVLGIRGLKDVLVEWNDSSADRFSPDLRKMIIDDTGVTEQQLEEVPNLREHLRSWKQMIDENNSKVLQVFGFHMDMTDAEVNKIPDLTTKIKKWHAFLEDGTKRELQRSMRMLSILPYSIMGALHFLGDVEAKTVGVSFGSEAETGDPELDAIVRRMLTFYMHFDNPVAGETTSGESFVMSVTNAPENEKLRDGYIVSFRAAGGLRMPVGGGYVMEINASTPDITIGFSPKKHAALKGLKIVDGAASYVMARISNEKPGGIAHLGDANASNLSFDTWGAEIRGSIDDISLRATARFSVNLARDPESDSFLQKIIPANGLRKELEVGLGMSITGGIFVTLDKYGPYYLSKPKPEPEPEATPQPRNAVGRRDAAPPAAGFSLDKELKYSLNKTLGPLKLNDLFLLLQAQVSDNNFIGKTSAGLNFGLKIGPVGMAVEGIGLRLTLTVPTGKSTTPAPEANLGIANLDFGFKPPVGIALGISAKVVEGVGYLHFDPERGTYLGALTLNIKKKVTVGAVAILHTKLPEIPGGYSLLVMINTTFEPGISLPFGFFLKGLGGILGLHRTIAVERIRADMTSGSLEKILFPNIDALNVRQLVQDLDHYFPVKSDQFFGGLMARIVWGAPAVLVMDVGLMLEAPFPLAVGLVGMVKATLPNPEKPVLQLRCAVLGEVDFEKGFLALDARLYDSRLLSFTLEGDVALRIRWAGESGFLLSVGGFHPAFKPPASLDPGTMTRITFRLADIDNPELVMTSYFAVTSNTVQFGSRTDAKAKIGSVRAEGFLYYDALFQFSPFRMMVALGGGVSVSYKGYDLFSVKVEGTLEGPGPWTIHLTFSFSVWLWDVDIDYSKTWGRVIDDPQMAVAVMPLAKAALEEAAVWTAPVPDKRFIGVRLKERPAGENAVMVQPIGSLRVSQTAVPLDRDLDKFGNNRISDVQNVAINKIKVSGKTLESGHSKVEEDFAPSLFRDMSEAERLKAKSFEKGVGGFVFNDDDLLANFELTTDNAYDPHVSDFDPVSKEEKTKEENKTKTDWPQRVLRRAPVLKETAAPLVPDLATAAFFVKNGSIARSQLSKENRAAQKVLPGKTAVIWQERFAIAHTDKLEHWQPFSKGTEAEAEMALRKAIRSNPGLKGKLQVVPEYIF